MPVTLVRDNYGKERVRLVKVTRHHDRHDIRDITVGIRFEGDYAAVHSAGDNSTVLPTDTMKNTVYALAHAHPLDEIERFGATLARHFLGATTHVSRARVEIAEHAWSRMIVGGRPHDHAFTRGGDARRVARVTGMRDGPGERLTVESGIRDLVVLKTSGSAFEGYLKDRYTTLRETSDRIFATAVSAIWRYVEEDVAYNTQWHGVRQLILETFADHDSRSVQHTLHAIGDAVLEQCPEIAEIALSLPNKHHLLADLSPFGLENANEIFIPTDEPYGLIEAVVARAR
ncbi:MAG: factor-independent urate hydroxylase [Gemmatimonadaceae bacterium]